MSYRTAMGSQTSVGIVSGRVIQKIQRAVLSGLGVHVIQTMRLPNAESTSQEPWPSLPYEVVRSATSPDAAIAAFIDSTYDHAATLADGDRTVLERPVHHPSG